MLFSYYFHLFDTRQTDFYYYHKEIQVSRPYSTIDNSMMSIKTVYCVYLGEMRLAGTDLSQHLEAAFTREQHFLGF